MKFFRSLFTIVTLVIMGSLQAASPIDAYLPADGSAPAEGVVVEARLWDSVNMGNPVGNTPIPDGSDGKRADIEYHPQAEHAYTDGSPSCLRFLLNELAQENMHFIVCYADHKCGTCGTYRIKGHCGFSVVEKEEDGIIAPFYFTAS